MKTPTRLQKILKVSSDIEPGEVRASLTAFFMVLVLMAAYYIMRPVRDAMASDWSDAQVSILWTLTFFFSAAAVSLYGAAVARISFQRLVPSVYCFFAFSFVLFYSGSQVLDQKTLLNQAFYVWISVFSLFHISVFWSFMADIFSQPQAIRLFGFIGAGASAGGIIGPALPSLLVNDIGTDNLLLLAAVLLLATLPLILQLQSLNSQRLQSNDSASAEGQIQHIGGNSFAGFSLFLKSPYLLGIGLFIFLYTSISSFVYFELKNLMADYDRETRTQIWAMMDLTVNSLTLMVAAFATGRIANRMGLPFTLASIPALIGAGMITLAMAPTVGLVIAIQIIRRAGNYAISRPAREMLFTAVDRETRFKAKPVIDIVIYRGGDMLNAWAFTALSQGLGLGLSTIAGVGAGIALLWGGVGIYLGRKFQQMRGNTQT